MLLDITFDKCLMKNPYIESRKNNNRSHWLIFSFEENSIDRLISIIENDRRNFLSLEIRLKQEENYMCQDYRIVVRIDGSTNENLSLFGTGCMGEKRRKKSLMIFSSPTLYDPS